MMQVPAGLGALIQRGMPQRSREEQRIPPGLQALMQAQKVLQSQASPVTPAGTPTIAGQTEQAIAQRMQPVQAPQGLPGMMQADPFREQLMKTLQAQAQQQMQPQQPPQEQPAPEAQPAPQAAPEDQGIGQLPAPNMQGLKEGGVVGYAYGGVTDFRASQNYGDDDQQQIENLKQALMGQQTQQADDTLQSRKVMSQIEQLQEKLRQAEAMTGPKPFTREMAYEQAEGAGIAKPWEQKRQGIEQLAQKNAEILQRKKDLYNQEVASRQQDIWANLLAGAGARGAGGAGAAVQATQEQHRARDAAFTGQLEKDLDFTRSLFDLSNSANKDEWDFNLKKSLDKVTDYEKAADIFKTDRQVLTASLRGDLGKMWSTFGQMYSAEQRKEASAGKQSNMTQYVESYVDSAIARGDTRPYEELRAEGAQKYVAEAQKIPGMRAATAERGLDAHILADANRAVDRQVTEAAKIPSSPLNKALRNARKSADPMAAEAEIKARLLRDELTNRNVPEDQINKIVGAPKTPSAPAATILKFDAKGNPIQ